MHLALSKLMSLNIWPVLQKRFKDQLEDTEYVASLISEVSRLNSLSKALRSPTVQKLFELNISQKLNPWTLMLFSQCLKKKKEKEKERENKTLAETVNLLKWDAVFFVHWFINSGKYSHKLINGSRWRQCTLWEAVLWGWMKERHTIEGRLRPMDRRQCCIWAHKTEWEMR